MVFVHEGQKYDMDEAALVAEPKYYHLWTCGVHARERLVRLWRIANRFIGELEVAVKVPVKGKWEEYTYVDWRMLSQDTVDEIANQTQDARLLAVIPLAGAAA